MKIMYLIKVKVRDVVLEIMALVFRPLETGICGLVLGLATCGLSLGLEGSVSAVFETDQYFVSVCAS